jgi:hypothetical protein
MEEAESQCTERDDPSVITQSNTRQGRLSYTKDVLDPGQPGQTAENEVWCQSPASEGNGTCRNRIGSIWLACSVRGFLH